jgi:hypothetical protein
LCIDGSNSKRYAVAMTQVRPHKELCRTRPKSLMEDVGQSLVSLMSAPYPISWLDQPTEEQDDEDFDSAFFADSETSDSAFLA